MEKVGLQTSGQDQVEVFTIKQYDINKAKAINKYSKSSNKFNRKISYSADTKNLKKKVKGA